MTISRVAIIFDDVQRPETTGGYCLRALKRLVDVEHFQPGELAQVPRDGFDLYLNIDDGLRYRLPGYLRPAAWWAIDTHLDFAWCLQKAQDFDLVFAAQRDGAEALRQAGVSSAAWLPLACDPDVHQKHEVDKQYDVAFVGHVFPGPRADLLNLIRRRYPRAFIGERYFEEMARVYSAARSVFNRSIKNDVNMRVFEALSCGSLLVTNDLSANGQAELFRDGVHLAAYREPEDLLDKLEFYLGRESLRGKVAAAGRAEVLEKHTYLQRMERLLREAARPSHVSAPITNAKESSAQPDNVRAGAHDAFYFSYARPEVMALVPETARSILDIGCGAGRLGAALKARQPAEVVGVELDQAAAAAARTCLDEVLVGDVEKLDLNFPQGRFDAIICGDILEHLKEPERLLRKAHEWLAPGGCLVASIPNVRHHTVVRSLLEGNWTYEPAGLLDRTHMRFFTRREIQKLFFRARYGIDEMRSVVGPGDHDAIRGDLVSLKLGRHCIDNLADREAFEFYTYQYLLRARPMWAPEHGLTSIVIVTHNQLEFTRQCLESVKLLTDEPYEFIVVDNGSTDGTVAYLQGDADMRLIKNQTNRGFPAAVNQGIAVAKGNQVLLLNNDVIVTTGWLSRMLRALHSDASIGLVGPSSNFVSGPQQIEGRYGSLSELDGFAWDWGAANHGRLVDIRRLVGFCLLIRRSVIDAIGPFDEQFGVGWFEDDDFTLRAIRAGYRAVIAADAFIHHFGGRTFIGCGVDTGVLHRENERKFREKWSKGDNMAVAESAIPQPATATPVAEAPPKQSPVRLAIEMAPSGGLRLRRDHERPRLSLCMIVRDSSRTLPLCLASIRPWVDEMIIVDTGSLDETPRIAESFGAKLFHFPWCDDFSAARNESLRHATGEWVFWMDADDTIPPECGRKLRRLLDSADQPNVLGYVMQVHCPDGGVDSEPDYDVTVVDHVKLFRNRPHLRFDGRIHEQILPAIRAAAGDLAWTDIYVVHSGSDQSPAGQQRKLARDLRILELELADRPEHPFTLFNLGMTHVHGSDFARAVDYLRRGIARAGPADSHLRKAFALLVYALMRLGRYDQAVEECRHGRGLFPQDTELRFREGVLLHDLGRLDEARRAYIDVLSMREERHFSSVDRGLTGFKARQNLALVASEMGDLVEAERQWREVVREVPQYRQGWRGLGETMLREGRYAEVDFLAEELSQDEGLRVEGLLLKSHAATRQGRLNEAREALDRAVTLQPDDIDILRGRCQFLFDHGSAAEAEVAFAALIARVPDDASAHHNLGTLLMRAGRCSEAVQAYHEALRYRPNYAPTFLNLGYALRDSGLGDEARAAWEQVLRLSPNHPVATHELAGLRLGVRNP